MKVIELNNEILFEVDLRKLQKEYEKAKKELNNDINVKIVLDKLKDFVIKYMTFDKKYNIRTKKITEIESIAKRVLEYIKIKVYNLKSVKQIDKEELKSLEDFLKELHNEILKHVEIQKVKYKRNVSRR